MKLRSDHLMHLKGGIATLIASAVVAEVQRRFGMGAAIAFGGIVFWGYVEGYQWARGNGAPEGWDWFWGALPATLAGAAVIWWGWR